MAEGIRIEVNFTDWRLEKEYYKLNRRNRALLKHINNALVKIEGNPTCAIEIPKRLIPEIYVKKYDVNHLWKYNLLMVGDCSIQLEQIRRDYCGDTRMVETR